MISSDGARIAAPDDLGSTGVWDVASGLQTASIPRPPNAEDHEIAHVDGPRGTIDIKRSGGRPFALAFSPDGELVAEWDASQLNTSVPSAQANIRLQSTVANLISTIRILDVATCREKQRLEFVESAPRAVTCLPRRQIAFSPNGQWLASMIRGETSVAIPQLSSAMSKMTSLDFIREALGQREEIENRVQIWDLSSARTITEWREVRASAPQKVADVWAGNNLSFTHGGRVLAVRAPDDHIMWFDLVSGRQGGGWVIPSGAASITADSDGVVAISEGSRVSLRDYRTGRQLRILNTVGPVQPAAAIAFDPSGHVLRTSGTQAVNSCNLDNGTSRRSLVADTSSRIGPFFSQDAELVAFSGHSSMEVWNMATGRKTMTVALPGHRELLSGVFSTDGRVLALSFGVDDDPARAAAKSERLQIRMAAASTIESLLVAGLLARTNSTDPLITQAFPETSRPVRRFRQSEWVLLDQTLVQASDGLQEMEKADNGSDQSSPEIQLFNVPTGRLINKLVGDESWPRWPKGGFRAVAISPDDNVVAAADNGFTGRIGIWDVKSGRELPSLNQDVAELVRRRMANIVSFGLSGDELIAAKNSLLSDDPLLAWGAIVSIWDLASGNEKRRISCRHGRVTALSSASDRKLIAIGSEDGSITVFDMETGAQISDFNGGGGGIHKLSFFPDGRVLDSLS